MKLSDARCTLTRSYFRPQTDYGVPQPPYKKHSKGLGGADSATKLQLPKNFWEYAAPRPYQTPASYRSPRPYGTPKAYGPGQDSGGGSGGSGGKGYGGGGGGGFGDGLPRSAAFLFALLVAVGGYMGYKKKGSTASLKASSAFAAVLLLAGVLIGGPWSFAGLALALVANLALGAYMLKGYANTRKIFPQAVFAVFSALNSLLYVKKLTGT